MNHEVAFDSIESTHEFLTLVAQVVLEAKRDIGAHLQREMSSSFSRRLEALQIIVYLLETLEIDIKKSRRILNDLRSLRRLLFEERTAKPNSIPDAKTETLLPTSPSSPPPEMSPSTDMLTYSADRHQ